MYKKAHVPVSWSVWASGHLKFPKTLVALGALGAAFHQLLQGMRNPTESVSVTEKGWWISDLRTGQKD